MEGFLRCSCVPMMVCVPWDVGKSAVAFDHFFCPSRAMFIFVRFPVLCETAYYVVRETLCLDLAQFLIWLEGIFYIHSLVVTGSRIGPGRPDSRHEFVILVGNGKA